MFSRVSRCALVASIISNVAAQTPVDFQPGTLVKLGVAFPAINIDPIGSNLASLDQAQNAPAITIPMSLIVGQNGQVNPNQRFMVFMIDTDVVQQNVQTTVLHWFQPDMVVDGAPPGGIMPPSAPGANTASTFNDGLASTTVRLSKAPGTNPAPGANAAPVGQTDYLPPGPPPGPAHRYVQVLFAQPSNFSVPACFQNILSTSGNATAANQARLGFDINQFLAATNVRTRPIAGNYFRAQNAQPGPLNVNVVGTGLVNAGCPGVPVPGQPAPARQRRWVG